MKRKEKVKELRKRLANLSEEERQALANKGAIATLSGRVLSPYNTILVYLQSNGSTPTVVGGYRQWRREGRQVVKGEHGYLIFFPVGEVKDEETGDVIEPSKFYTTTVFDKSQTAEVTA